MPNKKPKRMKIHYYKRLCADNIVQPQKDKENYGQQPKGEMIKISLQTLKKLQKITF